MELDLIRHWDLSQQPSPLSRDAQLIATLLFIIFYLSLATAELLLPGKRPGHRVGMNHF